MKITKLEISNIRCFIDVNIELSPGINVIVGPNNNGKTTLLNCISVIQQPRLISPQYSRLNADYGVIKVSFDNVIHSYFNPTINKFVTKTNLGDIQGHFNEQYHSLSNGIPNTEPLNYIIPYQSRRKVGQYSEGITKDDVSQVTGTLSNLYAKIDRISNPEYQPAYSEYIKACDEIIGFRVSTFNSNNGKKAGYIIRNEDNIPIDMMGEGIASLLGLIVDLCRVENKLFIIEEPENDIHPKALKKLLDLIAIKSTTNQFVITTHSNIVLRNLGAVDNSKIFKVEMSMVDKIPTSKVELVETSEDRRFALEDLGYELFDYNLWSYWIFFEESSAERIIRDFLIPWFFPHFKNKVRTFSARTSNEIKMKFDDFNRIFVFLHLQEIYKNRVWIVIDSGHQEKKILDEIYSRYKNHGWEQENFIQLGNHDFEQYYPKRFSVCVDEIIKETDGAKKRYLKHVLLDKVIKFSQEDARNARSEFKESASEVLMVLNNMRLQ